MRRGDARRGAGLLTGVGGREGDEEEDGEAVAAPHGAARCPGKAPSSAPSALRWAMGKASRQSGAPVQPSLAPRSPQGSRPGRELCYPTQAGLLHSRTWRGGGGTP